MRKAMIMLAAMACCWFSGCDSTLKVTEITWKVDSIPEGIWGWDITIPGYTGTSSIDPLKGIQLLLGMRPIK